MSRDAAQRGPGIRCHAPVLFGIALVAAWRLNAIWPLPIVVDGLGTVRLAVGWLLGVAGLLLFVAAISTLIRARTTFLPNRASNALIVAGPFALSRNPIYVGFLSIYVGIALIANTAWPIVILPLVWIVLRMYIIAREEHYLGARFGDSYAQYRRRVRRWL